MLHRRGVLYHCSVAVVLLQIWSHTCLLRVLGSVLAAPIALPNYTIYSSRVKIFEELEELVSRNPSSMKIDEMYAGDAEYASSIKVVTVVPGGLTEEHNNKLRLLLDFGEHGRELVTVEVALRLLDMLGDPSSIKKASSARGGDAHKLLNLLDYCTFKIIPMENEQGRSMVENGTLCERKNGRGVDSNRNWPVHWGFREKDYDPSEEYPGKEPFSEPEVQLLNKLAKEFEPHIWMNMHSGMEALFMPYDHVAALPDDEAGHVSFNILQQLNAIKCQGHCAIGSGGKSVGYLAHGTATDYMHDILGVPLSFTWEIYGDLSANFHDCFRMFNPLSKDLLQQVTDTWADAIMAFLELLPSSAKAMQSLDNKLHRKLFPTRRQEEQYNQTETDIAAALRQKRLEEIYRIVLEVELLSGLPYYLQRRDLVSSIPFGIWIAVVCFALLTTAYVVRRGMLGQHVWKGKSRTLRRKESF